MNLRFYKIQDCWFVDYPEYLEQGGSIYDLQMVSGADDLLEELTSSDEVVLQIFTEEPDSFDKELVLEYTSEEGAFYIDTSNSRSVYLCPVTLEIFGEYPPLIYFKTKN